MAKQSAYLNDLESLKRSKVKFLHLFFLQDGQIWDRGLNNV